MNKLMAITVAGLLAATGSARAEAPSDGRVLAYMQVLARHIKTLWEFDPAKQRGVTPRGQTQAVYAAAMGGTIALIANHYGDNPGGKFTLLRDNYPTLKPLLKEVHTPLSNLALNATGEGGETAGNFPTDPAYDQAARAYTGRGPYVITHTSDMYTEPFYVRQAQAHCKGQIEAARTAMLKLRKSFTSGAFSAVSRIRTAIDKKPKGQWTTEEQEIMKYIPLES